MTENTKFEQDLKDYFPEIYKLNQVGKWDKFLWKVIDALMVMVDNNETGEITIRYNSGRIDGLWIRENRLAGMSREPNLSRTGTEEVKFDNKDTEG